MLVLMLAAARMQPKKHTLITRLSYIHLAGAHSFLRNMFPCFRRFLKVGGDPYPFALSVTDIGGRAHSPVQVPPPLT